MAPRRLGSTAAAGLSALALHVAAPGPTGALRQLGSAARASDLSGPLVAAAALLAWALLAQLVLVAALTLVTALPGRTGAAGEAVLRRCAPAGLRRAVALALGVGLLVGAGAGAAGAAPGPPPATSLDWPTAQLAAAALVLDWPASPTSAATAPLRDPAPETAAPAPEVTRAATPAASAQPPTTAAAPAPPSGEAVTVAAGDSLWSLARAGLPAGAGEREVAQAWPAWWSANRALIGDDPDLIHPGQTLRAPR